MTGTDHYFTAQPASDDERRLVQVHLGGRDVEVETAGGVFSPAHVDRGTQVLLGAVPPPPASGDLVDLGCGWGPVALSLAMASPDARVWAVDVNERALDLVRRNAELLGCPGIVAAHPDDVPDDVVVAALWSNPPIRVGKDALHALLLRWLPRLGPGAQAHLVVSKDLGADSLQRWVEEQDAGRWGVTRVTTAKGFRVLRVADR